MPDWRSINDEDTKNTAKYRFITCLLTNINHHNTKTDDTQNIEEPKVYRQGTKESKTQLIINARVTPQAKKAKKIFTIPTFTTKMLLTVHLTPS